ncbi:MAG: hypothetical protein KBH07_02000 [Flavobacteriales bacterium]|nr:hypothetical protein [Flavobacteriales bacterium]MBP9078895.1 hypothetical protein [Flavobacteriales bacterium]
MRGIFRFHLLVLALCTVPSAAAQGVLYRSHEEFVAQRGEAVDRMVEVAPAMGRFVLCYEQAGARRQVPTRKLWGFMNRGVFYRIEQQDRLPVRLMAQGAIYYWENGFAHLHMQRDSTAASAFDYGHACYLSRDLAGDIVPAAFMPDDAKSASARFKAAWPAYKHLLEQIGEGNDMDQVRKLVVEYEVAVEEGRVSGP